MVPYMLPHTFRSIKFGIQSVSVVLTFMINSLLIYLICTRSPKKMGTYRHLMIYFCCCSMFFSMMDIIVQPYIHTYKSAFFMIAEFRSSGVDQNVAEILIGILCACFSVTIYGIAIHFIYRYFALERKGRLKYFNRQFLPIWFSIPIIGGIAWDLVSIIFMPQEPTKTEYIRQTVKDFFDLEVQDSVYCGAAFYLPDETGKSVIHKESFYGSLLIIGIMSVPFGICIVTGWKSWKKVSDLTDYGESDYSKGLQMQLYKALIAQTVIPICFLFLPFGFLFTSPLFELNCQFLSAPCTFLYAIYPAVDPLPILFFVDDYRNSVTGILCACFSITIYGIAIHFIYRYFALERKGRLHYFNSKFLPFWFSIPIIGGIAWYIASLIYMSSEPEKTEYLRNTVKEFFDIEMEDSVYFAATFYIPDKNGNNVIQKDSFYGFMVYSAIMSIPFTTCLVSGWKSWKKVRDLKDYGESDYSKSLQMQLYKALIAQTVIPTCLLFLPFGFLFISPLFELNCQFLSAPCTFLYAIYPAVDPLPILFFVDDYRKCITGTFRTCVPKRNRVNDSRQDEMIISS